MPSSRQNYMLPLNRDKPSPQSSSRKSTDILPRLTESEDDTQHSPAMPVIRVPSSLSEVNINDAADSLSPVPGSTDESCTTAQQSDLGKPSARSKAGPARRRVTEGSLPAFKPMQPMLSLAARPRTDSLPSAGMHKSTAGAAGKQQPGVGIAGSSPRSGQMIRVADISARDSGSNSNKGSSQAPGMKGAAR